VIRGMNNKHMKIDILSDLHLDFYFKAHLSTDENVESFFRQIFTDNEARDIGDILIPNFAIETLSYNKNQ